MNEHDRAIIEGHEMAAEEEFFKARPALDCEIGRRAYRSAFLRAWQEAKMENKKVFYLKNEQSIFGPFKSEKEAWTSYFGEEPSETIKRSFALGGWAVESIYE